MMRQRSTRTSLRGTRAPCRTCSSCFMMRQRSTQTSLRGTRALCRTCSLCFMRRLRGLASCTRSGGGTDGPPSAWTCVYPSSPASTTPNPTTPNPIPASYCLPSQDREYDCGPEPYIGSLTCLIAQQSCGGGCDDGSTGSTFDQCNQCLSDGHTGLDGVATCDGELYPPVMFLILASKALSHLRHPPRPPQITACPVRTGNTTAVPSLTSGA